MRDPSKGRTVAQPGMTAVESKLAQDGVAAGWSRCDKYGSGAKSMSKRI